MDSRELGATRTGTPPKLLTSATCAEKDFWFACQPGRRCSCSEDTLASRARAFSAALIMPDDPASHFRQLKPSPWAVSRTLCRHPEKG